MTPQSRRKLEKGGLVVALVAYGCAWNSDNSTTVQRTLFAVAAVAYLVGVIAPAIPRARAAVAAGDPLWRRPTSRRLAVSIATLLALLAVGYVLHKEHLVIAGFAIGAATLAIIQIAALVPPRGRTGPSTR